MNVAGALAASGIEPREARLLLAEACGFSEASVLAHPERELLAAVETHFLDMAARRRAGEPIAYIVGRKEFYGLPLAVGPAVLIPRPETELLVELVLAATAGRGVVADVGTGSGAIALSLAAEGRYDRIIATDVSSDALAVARHNVRVLPEERRAVVQFRAGSFCAPLAGGRVGALVSNPPYIDPAEAVDLPPLVRNWEPSWALFAAGGGMAAIAAIAAGGVPVLEPNGLLALEVDARRAGDAAALIEETGAYAQVVIHKDLTGRERFVLARRKES